MMTVRLPVAAAFCLSILLLSGARSARADSDGYYCAGPAYLAYELSMHAPGGGHVLYIVPLRDSAGIAAPIRVPLPDFQVHGMRCTAAAVQLLGWDSLYTVEVNRSSAPRLAAAIAPWAGQGTSRRPPADFADLNIGGWSAAVRAGRSDTVELHTHSTRFRFLLAFVVQPKPKNCLYKLKTKLLELDAARHRLAALTLFDADHPMECGE